MIEYFLKILITFSFRDLEQVKFNLDEIAAQDQALLAPFKDANQAKVDRSMLLLSKSLERFGVSFYNGNHDCSSSK